MYCFFIWLLSLSLMIVRVIQIVGKHWLFISHTAREETQNHHMWIVPLRVGMNLLVAFIYSVHVYKYYMPDALQGLRLKDE